MGPHRRNRPATRRTCKVSSVQKPSKSAEILAAALERDADAQDRGEFGELGKRWADVRSEIVPINEIPNPLFYLAMRFWDDWGDTARHEWQYHEPFEQPDWPRMARDIANHVRAGTLPEDELVIKHFLPKPKKKTLLQRLKGLFS